MKEEKDFIYDKCGHRKKVPNPIYVPNRRNNNNNIEKYELDRHGDAKPEYKFKVAMGGDQAEKDKYSIGRVIGKHIPTNSLNVDWFKNWEENENYQNYYISNLKPSKEYYCQYEGDADHLLMTAVDIELFNTAEELKEKGKKCAAKKCKMNNAPIGILNKCADKTCDGTLEEKDGKTTCSKCKKDIKRAKYY